MKNPFKALFKADPPVLDDPQPETKSVAKPGETYDITGKISGNKVDGYWAYVFCGTSRLDYAHYYDADAAAAWVNRMLVKYREVEAQRVESKIDKVIE